MEDWAALFGSYLNSGVYAVTKGAEADIKRAAKARGLDYVKVDLKGVTGKTGFLQKAAVRLGVPSYFGMNWDAFSDCLTDMEWRPATGYVILFSSYQSFAVKATIDAQAARRVFNSSVQYWKQKKVPFYIIFGEKTP
jgi:RNAse (barnase) inhibitor barstar